MTRFGAAAVLVLAAGMVWAGGGKPKKKDPAGEGGGGGPARELTLRGRLLAETAPNAGGAAAVAYVLLDPAGNRIEIPPPGERCALKLEALAGQNVELTVMAWDVRRGEKVSLKIRDVLGGRKAE